jgi:hypothetical protein
MYNGTMINDLLNMVERAEEKAAAKRERERPLVTWYVAPAVDLRERAREAMRLGAA